MLRDYLWRPASNQVRAAVQDIYINEDIYFNGKPLLKPWWSEPPKPASFAADNGYDDPEGAFPLLCNMLYEASYPQAYRDDALTVSCWPYIGSLVRCGACLLTMTWSSDEWFILIRAFAIQRIPIYSRIFPQIIGDGASGLRASDLARDLVRGQNNPNRGYVSLAHRLEVGKERGNDQVPTGPDFSSKYRLDETLEIAGVVMLGAVTGGPAVRPDITDKRQRFLESFKHSPQIWFLLAPSPEPLYKDFVIAFVHRLALRARPGSDLMMSGITLEHPEIEKVLFSTPVFRNASLRRPGSNSWEPTYAKFDLLQEVAGTKHEPIPYRLMGGCPMIHLACKPTSPNGVELEELWMKLKSGWVGSGPDLEEPLPYRFGPWCDQDMREKDETSSTSLEQEDGPSNTLITGFQETHTGTVEINGSQLTPPHTCRSYMPTNEAMAHYSPSKETLMINCSTPVELPQQDYELHDSPLLSDAETNSTSQSSDPGLPLDDHREHASRERVILSEPSPPSKDRGQEKAHIDWFDSVMSDKGKELPDLSDWMDSFME
ncbi:unnamed protein product [Rhizoctonia solani]|uniref:Uncharacterized protein n=1 Tax=Rhizoctonia solani TaxID=456999 RepID=A0A8H3CFS9_9AGAM|nr:unnamed protein product [Rhizoctonia solani]